MKRYIVPSSEDMQRMSWRKRNELARLLAASLHELGGAPVVSMKVQKTLSKPREVLACGRPVSDELLQARQLLEESA